MGSARRLTGVAGRWSADHPWTAIAAWIGAVVVLMDLPRWLGWLPRPSRPAPPPTAAPPPVTRVGA